MVEIGLLLAGFLATLIAIKGETWNRDGEGLRRITTTGYITGCLAFVALVLSVQKHFEDQRDDEVKEELLTGVSNNTLILKDTINNLRGLLDSSGVAMARLQSKVETYELLLTTIRSESERQPQWTLLNYYTLRANQTATMPNRLHSGSLVRFVGLCGECDLAYGDKRVRVPAFKYSSPIEIPISGASGRSFSWSVTSLSDEDCSFKLYVLSTPRSRSTRWSFEEEADE